MRACSYCVSCPTYFPRRLKERRALLIVKESAASPAVVSGPCPALLRREFSRGAGAELTPTKLVRVQYTTCSVVVANDSHKFTFGAHSTWFAQHQCISHFAGLLSADKTCPACGNASSPDHADLRPSSLLLSYVIEKAAEEGIEVIDMLRGEEPYKRIWHADPVPTYKFSMPRVAHHAQPLAA